MIPILYESDETSFTSNGICRLRDTLEALVTEERNGIFEIDFKYPVDGRNFDEIRPGRIIAVTHEDGNDIQPFDIVSYSREIGGVVSFHGVHISYRLLSVVTRGTNINSLAGALMMLENGAPDNAFTYAADFTSAAYMAAGDGVPRSVRQMIGGVEGSILDTYGGELKFDKFKVELLQSRGELKPVTIRYGLNLTEYNEESDYLSTYTSAVPYWMGPNKKGVDVVLVGNRVDSGLTAYNGRNNCAALDLSEKFEEIPTKADLQALALQMITSGQTNLPARSIEVKYIDLERFGEYDELANLTACKLCDSLTVVFPRYGMQGTFKIVKTEYNVLQDRFESLELGSLSTTLPEALGITQDNTGLLGVEMPVEVLEPTYTRTAGATGVTVEAWQYGRVVQIFLNVPRNVATTAGENLATGKISGIDLPIGITRFAAYNGSITGIMSLDTDGSVTVRTMAASAVASSYFYFGGCYVCS